MLLLVVLRRKSRWKYSKQNVDKKENKKGANQKSGGKSNAETKSKYPQKTEDPTTKKKQK